MPVDMGGNPYIFSIDEFLADVLQLFIPAAWAGKLLMRNLVFMDNNGKVGNDLFLGALFLPLVTRDFNGLGFNRLRNGGWLFLAENAQLYRSVLHGRYTNLLALLAKVQPLKILEHLHDIRNTGFQLSNAFIPLSQLLLFLCCVLLQGGDVLSNIRAYSGEIRPRHTSTSCRIHYCIYSTRTLKLLLVFQENSLFSKDFTPSLLAKETASVQLPDLPKDDDTAARSAPEPLLHCAAIGSGNQ